MISKSNKHVYYIKPRHLLIDSDIICILKSMLAQPDPAKKLRLTKGAAAAVFQRIAAHASGLYHIAKNLVYKYIMKFAVGNCEEFILRTIDIMRATHLH